jgi:hypothetical protein
MSEDSRGVLWSKARIAASVVILVLAILNLIRFAGLGTPPSDLGTLIGEIALILLDLALFVSAFRRRK